MRVRRLPEADPVAGDDFEVVPIAIPASADPGDYDVYVSMPDIWPGTKDKADFAVRFANWDDPAKGQAWDAANFRFRTGTTLTVQ